MLIRFLSPVHIGSGQELQKGIDYDIKDNSLFFIDQEKLFNALVEKNELGLVEKFFDDCITTDFFKLVTSIGLNPNDFVYMKRSYYDKMKDTIKEFIRDGNGNYYIPGSSFKGAIKSVYFEKKLQNKSVAQLNKDIESMINPNKPNSDKKKAANKLMKVFSQTAPKPSESSNYDFFRVLQFKDFELQEKTIGVVENLILSLQSDNSLKVKEDKKSYAQAVFPDTEILVDRFFKIDKNLFKEGKMQSKLQFDIQLFDETNFINIVNDYAKKTIKSEIEFFKRYQNKDYTNKIINFYNKLLEKIEKNKNLIIFRMSAGSGWKFMTGNITLTNDRVDVIKTIRRIYRLGKDRVDIFPKTRRIAVCPDGSVYPLGWIEVDFSVDKLTQKDVNEEVNSVLIEKPKKSKETYYQKNLNRKYRQGDKLEAEVVSVNKPNVNVMLLDDRYKDVFSFKYPAGLVLNTIVEVEIKQIVKDKITQVAFSKKL